jgi:hypothetical protein
MEIWKNIKGYENKYQISNFGNVKSLDYINNLGKLKKGKKLKYRITEKGYNSAMLYNNGVQKCYRVHRLVAEAFIDNKNNKPFINHKDGNKLNNNIYNLEWCTHKENVQHAFLNNLNRYDINKKRDEKGRFI